MKLFYSTKDNKIKEIKIKYLIFLLLPFALFFAMSYSILQNFVFSSSDMVKMENKRLKENLNQLNKKFVLIKNNIIDLYEKEKKLRIASNLKIEDNPEFGIGGSEQDYLSEIFSYKFSEINSLNLIADNILKDIYHHIKNFDLIEKTLSENQEKFSRIPAIQPMFGFIGEHGFGMRLHPIYKIWKFHDGIDILGNIGDPVYSSANGKVIFAGTRGGYGFCVEIDHGYNYTTLYGHLSTINVTIGQDIKRFQKIGECGNTGLSSGPHLHYEVMHNGEKQDPLNYIFN